MNDKHRSETLDEFLDQQVLIEFYDGKVEQGFLFWNTKILKAPYYLLCQGYYLILIGSGDCLHFKKSHVKRIKKIKGAEGYEKR